MDPHPTTTQPTPREPQAEGAGPALPDTMRAVVARRYGTAEVLAVEEVPVPSPGRGEILVAVEASSLNALDWRLLTGTPYLVRLTNGLRRPRHPVPGADVAGRVVAVGAGVTRFRVGDGVFGESRGGGCSSHLTVDAEHVAAVPDAVSWRDAGTTPVAGLTALQGLRTRGRVQPGDHVLVNGAAGGVGTFAVQVAKALGAEVTAVTSSRNVELVRSLGADTVVDYGATDFTTLGRRFDVLFDVVGNRTAAECLRLLRPDGRLVAVSGPMTNRWLGPVPHLVRTGLAVRRAEASFHQFTAAPVAEDLAFLGTLLASGAVSPAIDRVIGLEDVPAALAEIGTGHTRAKIAVRPT